MEVVCLYGAGQHCCLSSVLLGHLKVLVELWSIPVVKVASPLLVDLVLELALEALEAAVFLKGGLWPCEL